jgi:DDE superfamily endonuclease
MDKTGAGLGSTQKSYIIGPAEEKDARLSTEKNREWAILIESINAIGGIIPPFFVNKRVYVFLDLIKAMLKLRVIFACSYNGWFNDVIALEYFKHFHKHAKAIGVYRLLLLDGYGSHATFEFKLLANKYKIIFLYLPAHTTYRLQPLNVGIFSPLTHFYSNEVIDFSRWSGLNISKREYLDWMIAARKKANIKSNILSAWKKAGLIFFNSDLIL